MKKKILSCFLCLVIAISAFQIALVAFADNISWEYDNNTNTLTISGQGDMQNYSDEYSVPWYSHIKTVENFVVENGVTSVGAYTVAGATRLKKVVLPDSVLSVGQYAFSSCSSLKYLNFSKQIISIADMSFCYDGLTVKEDFCLGCEPASYALYYAFSNGIPFDCESVKCGSYTANIVVRGMMVYYPYTAKVSGTFKFSSLGTHDTYGYLYDSEYSLLRSNDDASASNTNFSFTYDLVKGQTYYIAAKICNTTLLGSFTLVIDAIDYVVSGGIYAMLNPQGDRSNILIEEALINGEPSGGLYSFHVTEPMRFTFTINGDNDRYYISPDKGDVQDIVVQMCDINYDWVINGKDYAYMYKENSRYLPLFDNFVNYKLG